MALTTSWALLIVAAWLARRLPPSPRPQLGRVGTDQAVLSLNPSGVRYYNPV